MNWLFYALLSAFFASLTAILGKIGVKGVDSNVATAARSIIMMVAIVGLIASQGKFTQMFNFSASTTIFVILSALAGAASWLAYFKALQIGEASQVAPIDKLSIAITLIVAMVFLGEKFTWAKLAGTTLMIVGAILVTK